MLGIATIFSDLFTMMNFYIDLLMLGLHVALRYGHAFCLLILNGFSIMKERVVPGCTDMHRERYEHPPSKGYR